MKKLILAIAILLPLAAQAQERTYKFLLVSQGLEESKLAASLEAALLKSLPQVQLVRADPSQEEKRIPFQAQRWSCDGILRLQSLEESPRMRIIWILTAVKDLQPLTQGQFSRVPGSWSDQAEIFWIPLVTPLGNFIKEKGSEIPKAVEASVSRVTVKAVPGTLISGMEGPPQAVDDQGNLLLNLTFPASYTFTGSHPAYRTVPYPVFLLTAQEDIQLTQTPEKLYALEAGLMGGSFPYAAANWFPIPGRLFLRGGIHQFLLGLKLSDYRVDEPDTESVLASLPLWHVNLGVGYFLNTPENLVRYYVSMDVFARIMTPYTIALEPIAPLGLRPLFGLEYRPSEIFSLYAEAGGHIFWLRNPQAYLASQPRDGTPVTTFFKDVIGLEGPIALVGTRIYF